MQVLCERWLQDLRKSIEPTPLQREQALASQRYLRKQIAKTRVGDRVERVYMSGSFARRTAIRPVDDVDLIFEIDPSQWKLPFFGNKPKPIHLLNSFRGLVSRLYPDSSTRLQRRSVGLSLSHIHLDLVPAVINPDGDGILIPDRHKGSWLESNPKAHAEEATAMNRDCDKRGLAMIKLLKHWNARLPANTVLKSFVVETLAIRVLAPEQTEKLVDGLLCFWDNVAALGGKETAFEWQSTPEDVDVSWFGGELKLPDAVGNNIAGGMDSDTLDQFRRRARIARDHLHRALCARSEASALEHLRKIF